MNVALVAENLSKTYRLGVINHGLLFRDLQSWWARMRKKSDPNALLDLGNLTDRATTNVGIASRGYTSKYSQSIRQEWHQALDDVSFSVQHGETVGIVGRNGAGKSTLLKILSRVTLPSAGTARIRGRVASLLEVGTGFHPELTGRENIFLNGAVLGMSRKDIERKLDEIIDFSGIEKFIDTPVKRYSSGMYVRLAFAVSAHLEAEIMIVDEVLAVGDLHFQKKCLGKMRSSAREGRTVLFVSHNLAAVNQLCQRSILLHQGRLVKDGPSREVIAAYVTLGQNAGLGEVHYDDAIAPGQKAKLRRLTILDSTGKSGRSMELSQPFKIRLEYEIAEPIKGASVCLELFSEELGHPILNLQDAELDLQQLETRQPGVYSTEVEIPASLLNVGTYRLRAYIQDRFTVMDLREDAVLQMIDSIGIMHALGLEKKNSVLALQLPWSSAKIS